MNITKRFSWMLVILLAVPPSALLAGSNWWTSLGPDGAAITQIVIDPSAEMGAYVVTYGGGIFKTADGGMSWRPVNQGLPVTQVAALLVVLDHPATLYAASASAIFISTDATEHWSLQGSVAAGSISSLAFDPVSQTLFAGTSQGVFRSLDSGKTWEQPAIALRGVVIAPLAVSPSGTAYVVLNLGGPTSQNLFRSSDHGDTWTSVPGSPRANMVAIDPESSTIYVVSRSNVLASNDDAKTWNTLPPIGPSVLVNSVVPAGAGSIYASTNHGVYEYNDRSAVWVAVGSGISDTDVDALAISRSTPRRFYAAKRFGLVTNVENGSEWIAADHGLPSYATDVAVVQSEPAVVYAATLPGLFKTENHGHSWQQIGPSGTTHVEPSPDAHDTLYATGSGVVKTIDSGATWTKVNPNFATALAIAPSDSNTVYAALSDGFAKSTDGGNSWMNISQGLPLNYYSFFYNDFTAAAAVAVDPGDASRVYVADEGIYSTVSGGSKWALVSGKDALALAIDPSAPSIIYAGLYAGGVMKSINGGVTWTDDGLNGETIQTLAIDPTNSSVIYAGTPSGTVHRSMNGGADWSFFDGGLPRASVLKLSMNASGKQLYAATTAGLFGYDRDDTYLQSATKYTVSFLTDSRNFASAADCGDSNVNANAVSAGQCETFTLYDVNGGSLMDSDAVYLQAANGSFVSAENGGGNGCGGCASPLNANRPVAATWETFTIRRINGPGQISAGDTITLQSSGGNYVTAENGGANACSCDSPLDATRIVAREWETFVISIR